MDVTVVGFAEGPDAAARPRLQRDLRQSARGEPDGEAAREATGTGRPMLKQNRAGFFPYTPATNLLFALREALRMLQEEGLAERVRAPRSSRRERPAPPCRPGGSRSSARIRASTRAR